MESKAHALAAGLFTLLLGAALIAIVMWFGKREAQAVFYTLYTTGSVNGLKPDAPVRYRGVDVGRVTSIRLEPGGSGRIQLEIGIGADTPERRSSRPKNCSNVIFAAPRRYFS